MARAIKMEDWQLENCDLLGTKGKGYSGKQKFDGGSQDHSERVDLTGHLRPSKKKLVKKTPRKKHQPSVFQYLKKTGFGKTFITVRTKGRIVGSTYVDTMVITVNRFLFDNQIKSFGENIVNWYYENTKNEECSELFFIN